MMEFTLQDQLIALGTITALFILFSFLPKSEKLHSAGIKTLKCIGCLIPVIMFSGIIFSYAAFAALLAVLPLILIVGAFTAMVDPNDQSWD